MSQAHRTHVLQTLADAVEYVSPPAEVKAEPEEPSSAPGAPRARRGSKRENRKPRASDFDAVDWLTQHSQPWADPDSGAVYLASQYGPRWENHPIQGSGPRGLLNAACYAATRKTLPVAEAERALALIESQTKIHGPFRRAALRVARIGDAIFLDLHDAERRVVKITANDWSVEPSSPDLPFITTAGMKPLPCPEGGGDPRVFNRFLTTDTPGGGMLILAWIMGALRGDSRGAIPILVVNGPQGSGKSTVQQMVRALIDPNHVAIQSPPTKEDDFGVIAAAAHCYSLDNVSRFEGWMYDALCRLATGGGFQARKKYTDAEVSQLVLKRAVLINGIPPLTDRADFVERMIGIRLRPILETERRTEEELWDAWHDAEPEMMGIICDGLSAGLRNVQEVKRRLGSLPRMADFLVWAEACAQGLGIPENAIVAAFDANRSESSAATFAADPVCGAISTLVPDFQDTWTGSATKLLADLNAAVSETVSRSYTWPKSAQALSVRIDRAEPLLRQNGITFTRVRGSASRDVLITRTAIPTSPPSSASQDDTP